MSSKQGLIQKEIKLPYEKYFNQITLIQSRVSRSCKLNKIELENISPFVMNRVMQHMFWVVLGRPAQKAFSSSLMGAFYKSKKEGTEKPLREAIILQNEILDFDDDSILAACKLTSYDMCFFDTEKSSSKIGKNNRIVRPNQETIENIQEMIARSERFVDGYGPISQISIPSINFYVDPQDYFVNNLFIGSNTLWAMDLSKKTPSSRQFSDLLTLFMVLKNTNKTDMTNINKIGYFNPRLNKVFIAKTDSIPTAQPKELYMML